MESAEESESNVVGEKENDKLLRRSINQRFAAHKYMDSPQRQTSKDTSVQPLEASQAQQTENSYTLDTHASSEFKGHRAEAKYLKHVEGQEDSLKNTKGDCKRNILRIVVMVMFVIIAVGVMVIWILQESRPKKHIGNEYFDFIYSKQVLHVYNAEQQIILTGYLQYMPQNEEKDKKFKKCFVKDPDTSYCFHWPDDTKLRLYTYNIGNVHCANIVWDDIYGPKSVPRDCYNIEYGLWYGMPVAEGSFWPINMRSLDLKDVPYFSREGSPFQGSLEYFWLSTDNIVIASTQDEPLLVSINSANSKKFCIELDSKRIPVRTTTMPKFNYTICQGPDILTTYTTSRQLMLPHSLVIPYNTSDISSLVWSYGSRGSREKQMFYSFLEELDQASLLSGRVQYEQQWEENIGDFEYKPQLFKELNTSLSVQFPNMGLILPVHVVCSYDSQNFLTGLRQRYFVQDTESNGTELLSVDSNEAAIWDTMNPAIHTKINHKGNNGYSVLAEKADFPYFIQASTNTTSIHKIFWNFIAVLLSHTKQVSIQSAFRAQDHKVFREIPAIVMTTNEKKCFSTFLPSALTAGFHGYPYIMSTVSDDQEIDEELYKRWLQVSVFFPALKIPDYGIQFSNNESVAFTKSMLNLREKIVIYYIQKSLTDVENGLPLLRSLWMFDPWDYDTFKIDDEFFLGDSLLVAPVLCHGQRARDVYLPQGIWISSFDHNEYEGKRWIKDLSVPLSEIIYFTRKSQNS
ncbi:hypothetical protein ACJMK2_044052 [Sinanodonta woodiana]|uniref:Glycosyl hydrolase family 31 C-terminal domain-containing protein n=2 Tax=Sinanodonta woodiana TaxID=1069815 RepID=A0ABD3VYR7_SINWO